MKKTIATLAAVLCCTMTASAQEAQEPQEARNKVYTITLGHIEYAHHDEKLSADEAIGKLATGVLTGHVAVEATKYEEDVKSAIIKGLSSAYRFRYNDGLLRLDDVAGEGNLIADALITNIQAKSDSHRQLGSKDDFKIETHYTGIVEAVLTLKDAKTGEIIANPTVGGWGSGHSSFSSSDKAVRAAIERLSGYVTQSLNKFRPMQANIIESGTTKKDKQKEVYIDMGSSEGAIEGLHMGIYQIKKIAGREAKSLLGKLKIEAVEGADISRCKVTSGAKDVKEALDAGEHLKVYSSSK